jgi:hypothetical protein
MKNAPKRKTTDLARSYEPTPHERAALEAYFARKEVNPPVPRLKVAENDGATTISPDHPEPRVGLVLLMDALGTTDWDFLEGLLLQLADAGSKGGVDGRTLNFMLSVVKGVEPRDQVEAMLAAQMAAVHTATMTFAGRLAHVGTIPQQESAERALNKLSNLCGASGGTQAIPHRRGAKGHGRARHGQRGRTSDRRQRGA